LPHTPGALDATAAALGRLGTPFAGADLMILYGTRAPPWLRDLMGLASS
jgi:hypothetical protein